MNSSFRNPFSSTQVIVKPFVNNKPEATIMICITFHEFSLKELYNLEPCGFLYSGLIRPAILKETTG